MAMTDEKILQAVEQCRQIILQEEPTEQAERAPHDCYVSYGLPHLLYMCDEMPKLLAEGRREKVMRWLGFLQGVLWSECFATLDQLKRMNMPDASSSTDE